MDVVVIDGQWWNPLHWLVRWRSFDKAVHVLTVATSRGVGWSPELAGIKVRDLSYFKGRRITVHRFKGDTAPAQIVAHQQFNDWKGYDLRQWFMAGVLGITHKKWATESKQYTCSEFPYWAFQDANQITPTDDIVPLPRLFRYHPQFDIVFDGVCEWP